YLVWFSQRVGSTVLSSASSARTRSRRRRSPGSPTRPPTRGASATAASGLFPRRLDVGVVAEDVLRVVLRLDARQPVVLLRAVRGAHAILVVLDDEVHVGARPDRVRPQRFPEGARPGEVRLVQLGRRRDGRDVEDEARAARTAERGVVVARG